MGLTENIGSGIRKPGTFVTFDDLSGNLGVAPGPKRIALVGTLAASGALATAEEPVQVFSKTEADEQAGEGTFLALMAHRVFDVLKTAQDSIEVWLCGAADPSGTAAAFTFTVTGTATAGGDVVFRVAGRTLRATVTVGDSNTTVAAAMEAALDAQTKILPVTASVNLGVVTCTATVTGVNGDDIAIEVVSAPAGISVATAQSVSGAGTIDITNALDALGSRNYMHVAIENHAAADVTDADAHLDEMWNASKKFFRWLLMGETGTVSTATTLSAAANDKRMLVVSCEGCPNLPGEMAAAVGAMALTHPRPSYNWDGHELGLYPPSDSDAFLDSEIETLLAAGCTPLVPTPNGNVEVVRLVTTKTTEGGATFEALLDYANPRTTVHYALLIDGTLSIAIKGKNIDTELLLTLKDLALDILRQGEEAGDLHNVDDHANELKVESHPTIPTRILTEIPMAPTPNAHQIDSTVVMIVESAAAA